MIARDHNRVAREVECWLQSVQDGTRATLRDNSRRDGTGGKTLRYSGINGVFEQVILAAFRYTVAYLETVSLRVPGKGNFGSFLQPNPSNRKADSATSSR